MGEAVTDFNFEDTVRTAVGVELRRLRVEAGLTQADIAERTNSHRPIIGRIEHGRHMTTVDVADAYARACGGGLGHVLLAIDRALGLLPAQGGHNGQQGRGSAGAACEVS